MIGRRLTMRAHVERNVGPPGKDAWNMPLAPDYQPHAVVPCFAWVPRPGADLVDGQKVAIRQDRSEEHTSELPSLMRISYSVFCLHKKKLQNSSIPHHLHP